MPFYDQVLGLIEHGGPGVLGAICMMLIIGLWLLYTGRVHTDKEFDREVERGDKAMALATSATENTGRQQDQIESLAESVGRLTEQLGRRG